MNTINFKNISSETLIFTPHIINDVEVVQKPHTRVCTLLFKGTAALVTDAFIHLSLGLTKIGYASLKSVGEGTGELILSRKISLDPQKQLLNWNCLEGGRHIKKGISLIAGAIGNVAGLWLFPTKAIELARQYNLVAPPTRSLPPPLGRIERIKNSIFKTLSKAPYFLLTTTYLLMPAIVGNELYKAVLLQAKYEADPSVGFAYGLMSSGIVAGTFVAQILHLLKMNFDGWFE